MRTYNRIDHLFDYLHQLYTISENSKFYYREQCHPTNI
jgi:hypothetical protein